METRNILNYNGDVVGQLSLPIGTAEEVWQEKLAPYAAPPAPECIPDATPRQFRQALVLMGISVNQIEAALDQLPEPTRSLAQIEWEYSTAFIRTNPLVAQVGQLLGWTSEQLDALWKLAKTL